MKHVLLTGATGFLGSHLLQALLERNYKITILKRSTSNTWRIQSLLEKVSIFDIDRVPLQEAFKGRKIDAVIHTACNYGRSGEQSSQIVETNLLLGVNLLDAAILYQTDVFINTDTLLPKDINYYALSKKQFVEWLKIRSNQIRIINLRIEHMYGPNDDQRKFFQWLLHQLSQKVSRISLTEGNQLRDFIYIDDVTSAFILTLEISNQHEFFNEYDVGTGCLISVKSFVTELYAAFKLKNPEIETVLGFGDVPLRDGELLQPVVDNRKLKLLGWNPSYTIQTGIDKILGQL